MLGRGRDDPQRGPQLRGQEQPAALLAGPQPSRLGLGETQASYDGGAFVVLAAEQQLGRGVREHGLPAGMGEEVTEALGDDLQPDPVLAGPAGELREQLPFSQTALFFATWLTSIVSSARPPVFSRSLWQLMQ